jgi:TRAP-type mannitol/chloroaromatic compound transport system permease small subunit
MDGFIKFVDKIQEFIGKAFGLLCYPLVFVVLYEVVSRKIFNSPTVWGFDLTYMLYAVMFMMGFGYTLQKDGHVRIDIFYAYLSPKKKAILDLIGYFIFFFPFVTVCLIVSYDFVSQSWAMKEMSMSVWQVPLYPFKTFMFLGFLLLFIQGIIQTLKNIIVLKGGK